MLNSLNENACHFSRYFRTATKLGIVIICLPFWIINGIDNEKDEQSLKVIFYVLCNVNETSEWVANVLSTMMKAPILGILVKRFLDAVLIENHNVPFISWNKNACHFSIYFSTAA